MTRMSESIQPPEGDATIRILIADDHPVVRDGMSAMLDAPGIEVVGEASTGREAADQAALLHPDLILMDVRMPDLDGLQATALVKEQTPEVSVIIVTSFDSEDYFRRALEAGAAGYLLKGMSRELLLDSVRTVFDGGSIFEPAMLATLLGGMSQSEPSTNDPLSQLNERELKTLKLIAQGMTNREIGEQLSYSTGTIKNTVQGLIEKLGVSDRTQAAVLAVRNGLDLDLPESGVSTV